MKHADYPHEPGQLHGCDVCDLLCHCPQLRERGDSTPCVALAHDESLNGFNDEELLRKLRVGGVLCCELSYAQMVDVYTTLTRVAAHLRLRGDDE